MKVLAGALIAATLVLVACGEERAAAPPRPSPTATVSAEVTSGPRTVLDMAGRSIRLAEEVNSVVVLSPSAADFALALELEVVGKPSDLDPGVAPSAAAVGTTLNPDFPAIAALEPDLVIADAAFHGSRTRDFDAFPYPVYILAATNYEQVLEALTALGRATNRAEVAGEAVEAIEAEVAQILDEASTGRPAPRVLILTGGGRDVFGAGTATYIGSLLTLLGAENVLGELPEGGPLPGFGVISIAESAITAPDVVLILTSGEGGLAEALRAEPAWAAIPAVTTNRIHEIETALYLRAPGPRAPEALRTLAGLLASR